MNILPAIDLIDGKCIRLYQGRYDSVTIYDNDPIKLSQKFAMQGAKALHIVDLEGARVGELVHLDLILKIKEQSGLMIQMGGGVRTKEQVKYILSLGIDKIIIGSIAISKPHVVKEWLQEYGQEHFVIALDVRINKSNVPYLALYGWEKKSEMSLWELLDNYGSSNLKHVLCTDINRDGTLQGPNIDLYTKCVDQYPTITFQASGGVSKLEDLSRLKETRIKDVIIGKALYENKFTLIDALKGVTTC